ncbi:BREX-1 system adenine-specific DNA-methyltransferase PglX [Desulfonatronum parangueonense]
METAKLKKFAQYARRSLIDQVSAKLKLVLTEGSPARRENESAVRHLEKEIARTSKDQVIERVAYTWFNRFCALRFMDLNRYTGIGVVSPANSQTQPEILAEAKMGHIDKSMIQEKTRQRIFALLGGNVPSRDPQGEAYRLLLVSACNSLSRAMPFLFQRIADYTELLLPDDLLSDNSILVHTREAMTLEHCQDVEVIGWLYQFYISEKKDEVFEGLKKNKKINPENIPAATQLFTPHWIVRYLVENSLGRLWMLNRPNSRLIERMDYYIKPEQTETDFLRINSPEEIRLCDPACGSGHMLVYAFDLLHAIYEEEGYEPKDIPAKILKHNLYGIEIDERAGELAAFALTMKARQYDKRFLSRAVISGKSILPNICVLENVQFHGDELKKYMDFVGRDLFNPKLITTLHQFEEADNFGSLIRPEATDLQGALGKLMTKDVSRDAFLHLTHEKVLRALRQADYLSPKYHVVVANPPYMGSGSMNRSLSIFVQECYSETKSDVMACFMDSGLWLIRINGYLGMINQQSWMFLDYFKLIRARIMKEYQIQSLLHLGPRTFPEITGEVVQSVAFIFKNAKPKYPGIYFRLTKYSDTQKKELAFLSDNNRFVTWQDRYEKIPDSPIGYWFSENLIRLFDKFPPLSNYADVRAGLQTGNNEKFIRQWSEVSALKHSEALIDDKKYREKKYCKWYPYNKGGSFRKWFGNRELVVDWNNDGENIKKDKLHRLEKGLILSSNSKPKNTQYYFRKGVTWSTTGGRFASFRLMHDNELFDIKGSSLFPKNNDLIEIILGYLNSCVARKLIGVLTPTLDYNPGYIAKIPIDIKSENANQIVNIVSYLINIEKIDWNFYETSWSFITFPLLLNDYKQLSIDATYTNIRAQWEEMTLAMQRLEEENNRIFIEAYGLQDELTPEVPLKEITLTCNPHYRYGGNKTVEELEALLLFDTMKEFISYSVGCMFGRYSLDKPGLILANQGEGILDFRRKILDLEEDEPSLDDQSKIKDLQSKISFMPDVDNVIPILDGDWFPDDVTERFRKFLRVTFGEEHYEENLEFIEKAIGKDIRKYFLKDFYADHVRRYKKRPIYWLFTSPKGSFNALIYMHRYRPDTVSVVLNDYLREFRTKLQSHLEHLKRVEASVDASKAEKTKAIKEIEALKKTLDELDAYERDTLYPLATQQIQIDLDDGVKVNYLKFGAALKKIPGLDAKED